MKKDETPVCEFTDNPHCPMCGRDGAHLGSLGKFEWFRCIQCGWEFEVDLDPH